MKKHVNNFFFEWKKEKKDGYSKTYFRTKPGVKIVISIMLFFIIVASIVTKESFWSVVYNIALLIYLWFDGEEKNEKEKWDFALKRKSNS